MNRLFLAIAILFLPRPVLLVGFLLGFRLCDVWPGTHAGLHLAQLIIRICIQYSLDEDPPT